jgi:serine/threonine-protein kinase
VTQTAAHADTEPQRPKRAGARAPRAGRSGVRLGSVPVDSREELRFLQDRLALFGKTTFFIASFLLVATSSSDLVSSVQRYSTLSRVWHVVGILIALVLWRVCASSRHLRPRTLFLLDLVSTPGICWSFAVLGHYALQPYGFFTGLLAVTHVSVGRAMIVPSAPLTTLLLGAVSFAGLVISRLTMPWPPELALIAGTRGRGVLEAVLWSAAGVAVTSVASKVIYGLHEKALEVRKLGQYSLEDKIGEGGMGEVYRARHAMLRRPTAVKLLSGDGSEAQLRRFEKEVQLTARLTHPNTISIYDYGRTPDGIFYYAMELLDGFTLEQLVERHGPQSPGRVIHLVRQVCGALKEAHRAGLIHRDIKPANIFLTRRGEIPDFVKVLDFGLVREMKGDQHLTRSNIDTVVGTPLFLSPEAVATPDRIDARADLYGLGCVAYFLVTGSAPFTGKNLIELCAHHLHTPPPPPSSRLPVPEDLERVILACLAKDRAARPESAEALDRLLASCRDAGSWGDAEAEAWWASAPSMSTPVAAHSPASGEQTRRTVCCVDIEERLEPGKRSA